MGHFVRHESQFTVAKHAMCDAEPQRAKVGIDYVTELASTGFSRQNVPKVVVPPFGPHIEQLIEPADGFGPPVREYFILGGYFSAIPFAFLGDSTSSGEECLDNLVET
jgi:hypothetical protein